ncbi:MAG: histidine kinase, partial [Candidatus Marinimicrobia bacterium]|nr:histidine kinase [Candidatus Neomarinimicrobiota bacterium]
MRESGTGSSISEKITVIYIDSAGEMWIGTDDAGVNLFDPITGNSINYKIDPSEDHSLSNNKVLSIYEDKSGMMWIGTWNGVNKYSKKSKKFARYTHIPDNPNSLNDPTVWSIYEEDKDIVWCGTDGGGLNRLDLKNSTNRTYIHDPSDPQSLSANQVLSIIKSSQGDFWIGTIGGLSRLDSKTGKFINYYYEPGKPDGLSDNSILRLFEDTAGKLWIGTYNSGIDILDLKNGKYTHLRNNPNDPNSLSRNKVTSIVEDSDGTMWIGTDGGGVNRYYPRTGKFTHYEHITNDRTSLSDNFIMCLYNESPSTIWVGTYNCGLNKLDKKTGKCVFYTVENGLPNNSVYGILPDNDGFLWMSTNYGLSRFNPETEKFTNFFLSDGLQSEEFNMLSYYKGASGRIYFGGIDGFNAFYPEDIKEKQFIPPVRITDLKVFNESIPFQKFVDSDNEIKLNYKENFLSFEFTSLDYSAPETNRYTYMLEGVNNEWMTSSSRRYATYTNLDPGKYIFKVKGSNSDGVWNPEPAVLHITIIPPFWQTWWFETFIIVVCFSALYLFYQLRITAYEAKRKKLEIEVEKRTREIKKKTIELEQINLLQTQLLEERDELIEEFREALIKIKTLSGMIPICASCKKIRDDSGFWQQVETYFQEHSGAEFSHSLCPDCLKDLYPEFYAKKYGAS